MIAILIMLYQYFTRTPETPLVLLTRTAAALSPSLPAATETPIENRLTLAPTTAPAQIIIDTDGDAVPDTEDYCPDALPGATNSDPFGCPTVFDPFHASLTFSDDLHIARYQPFWTGDCNVLTQLDLVICDVALAVFRERVPDAPSTQWTEVSKYVLRNLSPEAQGPLRIRLWDMGRRAFYNWADQACRTVSTIELIQLGELLREINGSDQVDEIAAVMDEIAVQLDLALSRRSPC